MKIFKHFNKQFFLVILILIAYLALFIDTIKYPGATANHFFIDAKVYFALSITLLIFVKTKTKILNLLLKANKIFLPVVSAAYIFLILLEGSHYQNYILNLLHIHVEGLIVVVLFSLAIYLADKFKPNALKFGRWTNIIYKTMIFLIIFFVVKNAALTFDMAFTRNFYIPFHLLDSYDDKMYYRWADFYKFMVFVNQNTPETATIIVPPEQNPWLIGTGNPNFVRSFLYPRKVVSEKLIIPEAELKSFDNNTYLLISWGKEVCSPEPTCHGWPRQIIKASKIIFKNPNSSDVIEIRENFIYDPDDKTYVYGLIKL